MDRFIEVVLIQPLRPSDDLKSNMDRFIGQQQNLNMLQC